jgi:hypothetical protein
MTLIIGVDPGGTTGLAAVEYTERDGYALPFSDAFPLLPIEAVATIESYIGALGTDVWWIAAERFVVSRRAGRSSSAAAGQRARDILGALQSAFPGRIRLRNAGAAKAWATDRRVKAAGLWPTQGRPHTTDAVRHALLMQVQLGNPDPLSPSYPHATGARP